MNEFDRPIGGEAWTIAPPKTMPWDRPPEFAEVGPGLKSIFNNMKSPKTSRQLVNLMDAGIPIDILAETILTSGFGAGKFGAPAMMSMVGPVIVMMSRMAEETGITPRYSSSTPEGNVDFEPDELFLANKNFNKGRDNKANNAAQVADLSMDELSNEKTNESRGFVQLPERMRK